MIYDYKNILRTSRLRTSSIKRNTVVDEIYSDRSRILYSSSFRRLQQKAQVFSLESNASVRTRMTHSLEVSDLGRTLANKIAQKLNSKNIISVRSIPLFVAAVENVCLIHDIGNPPFGHFGEAAIKAWAKHSLKSIAPKEFLSNDLYYLLMKDFEEFDGNPQGFRIITRLHTEQDEYSLNLTYATLLCALKYSRSAGEEKGEGILKKAGYFQTEKNIVERLYNDVGLQMHHRYPLTYIIEAADDIAYCLSDISDGIEKRIITADTFAKEFKDIWKIAYPGQPCSVSIPDVISNFSLQISVPWSKKAIDEATDNYINNHSDFYTGVAKQLIPEKGMGQVLKIIKQVSKKVLYTSIEAESIELTGYAVITGILAHYERLLKVPCDNFLKLIHGNEVDGLDLERRLYNRLGKRYVKAYIYAIEKLDIKDKDYYLKEWWFRVHLIVDHVSGMTDEFALATYQMFQGINLLKV